MYAVHSDEYIIYKKIYYIEARNQKEAKAKLDSGEDIIDIESVEEFYSHNKVTKVEKTKLPSETDN